MTQILTLLTHDYVLQASDRLVSYDRVDLDGKRITEPHDPDANKSIIYHAKNAMVAIGYAGTSYLEDRPSDEWIAELLFGEEIPAFSNGELPLVIGSARSPLEIGHAVRLLQSRATPLLKGKPGATFQVSIGGWQWKSDGRILRPIGHELTFDQATGAFRLDELPRYWCLPGPRELTADGLSRREWPFVVIAIPDGMLRIDVRDRLVERLKMTATPQDHTEALLDAMREVSAADDHVGDEFMLVQISRRSPEIEVSFVPSRPRSALVRDATSEQVRVPVTVSPWIVGPNLASPPSIIAGSAIARAQLGGFHVKLQGPASGTSVVAARRGEQRKRAPRRATPKRRAT